MASRIYIKIKSSRIKSVLQCHLNFIVNVAKAKQKKKIGSQATFFQIRWGRQVFFFFYFQSNIRHMCSTLL